jgi:hypothetical protein
VPGARHTRGLDAHPREYERRIVSFFNRYLLETEPSAAGVDLGLERAA